MFQEDLHLDISDLPSVCCGIPTREESSGPKSLSAWGLGERRGQISGDWDYRKRGTGWIWEAGKATGSEKGEQKHTSRNSKSQWNKASGSHSPQLTAPTGDLARKIFWDLAYALGVNGLIGLENKSPQHSWKQGPQQNILKLKDEEQSCQDFNYI